MAEIEDKTAFSHASHLEAVNTLEEKMHGKELENYAREGAETEHELGPIAALKAYPMAVFWSLMVSMCVIMEGQFQNLYLLFILIVNRL